MSLVIFYLWTLTKNRKCCAIIFLEKCCSCVSVHLLLTRIMSLHECVLILSQLHVSGLVSLQNLHKDQEGFPLKCQAFLFILISEEKPVWKMGFVHDRYSHSQFLLQIVVICDFVGRVNSDTGICLRSLLSCWFV